ncbi:hypothetical protein BH11MYX2_BH11MYX2_07320 [soil metagenome]
MTAATDIYALGATIVALAGGIEPEDVPRKGLTMDLARHLPQLDADLRDVLIAMTDPDPDKRPQRARDVVALLAKPGRSRSPSSKPERALVAKGSTNLAPRKMFSDLPEPAATLMRFGVLAFGAGGWVGMAGARLGLAIVMSIAWVAMLPAKQTRARVRGVGRELDSMLGEGQGGFADLMKSAMARRGQRTRS